MKTCCCSSHCKKYFDCQLADINNKGMNIVENYHEWGSGTYTDEGCVIEHYCGELGNYKMFVQVEHKWNELYEKTPPVNKEVELKVIVDGEERIYVNRLIPMRNGVYKWAYCDYDDCDEVVAWRYLPLKT